MTNIWRKLLIAFIVTLVAAPQQAAAQDDADAVLAQLDALGLTPEDVEAEDANDSWDGLGLFSDDATRLLAAVSGDLPVETYAFGDSKDNPPIINPSGALPTGSGTAAFLLPDDWSAPAAGIDGSMAFAQTPGSQIAPGDEVFFVWVEFDSEYDFSQTDLTINEGFPLTLPGLPVWNSSFAGDTWEGANLIPNAVYDGSTLTFDVKSYEPPQSFPLIDVPGFYYRSGNVMAMALGADALMEIIDAAATGDAAAADGGESQDLLYTGGAETTATLGGVLGAVSSAKFFTHMAKGGTFLPGFIALGLIVLTVVIITVLVSTFLVAMASVTASTTTTTTTSTVAPTTSAPDETEGGANPSGETTSGTDIWWLLFAIAVVIIVAGAWWLWLLGKKKDPKRIDVGGTRVRKKKDDLHSTPRGSAPPVHTDVRHECDWAVVFQGDTQTVYLRQPAPGKKECCTYYVRVRSMTQMHDQAASFRQDILPQRQYIPDIDFAWNGVDYRQNASTRSGPAGRQDWQHGDGNPIDQSALGPDKTFWQLGQGEIPPEVVAQIGHYDTTQIRVYLKSECTGHENVYESRGSGELTTLLTSECTNDAPGESCPVELTAQGLHDGSVFGDLDFNFGDWTGSDIDELERYREECRGLGEDDDLPALPALPNPGKWDGHTHDTALQTPTREQSFADGDHSVTDDDRWHVQINSVSWCESAQQVPETVYDTTERVSSHSDARFNYDFWIRARMEKDQCAPGPCAGHTELQCHSTPNVEITMNAITNNIKIDGETFYFSRPVTADRHNPPALHQWQRWELH